MRRLSWTPLGGAGYRGGPGARSGGRGRRMRVL